MTKTDLFTSDGNLFDREVLQSAKRIHCQANSDSYYSTQFYPQAVRQAMHVLMAFIYSSRQLVRDPVKSSIKQLGQWAESWISAYESGKSDNVILKETAKIWHRYNLPFEISESFLSSLTVDIEQSSFQTMTDLESYLQDNWGVVNQMGNYVTGFIGGEQTLKSSARFGKALGLVRILCEARLDLVNRNQCYFAVDDAKTCGVTMSDLLDLQTTDETKALVKLYVELAYTWLEEGSVYIANLPPVSRSPARMIRALAEQRLQNMAVNDYDIFSKPLDLIARDQARLIKQTWIQNVKLDRI